MCRKILETYYSTPIAIGEAAFNTLMDQPGKEKYFDFTKDSLSFCKGEREKNNFLL